MRQAAGLVNLLPAIPVLLAHLGGVVAAVILLVRQEKRNTPALLALIGFGLLVVLDLANLARGPLIRLLSHRAAVGARLTVAGVGCCCSIVDVAGIVCLIVAIGLASRGRQATSSARIGRGS